MPYREADGPVKGQSQNIVLVTNTGLFVLMVLYVELNPHTAEFGVVRWPKRGGSPSWEKFTKSVIGLNIPDI